MISAFDISTSGLIAQRARLDAIASNLANVSSMRNEEGELKPFQARYVIFETDESMKTKHGAVGVRVAEVKTEDREPVIRNQPGHPLADKNGNVAYPDINMTREFVDALVATRAYEANIGVIEATKNMGQQTLRIIA